MVSVEKRLIPWLGFVSDLLGGQLDRMPHEAIFDQLLATFPAVAVSYNWSEPDGRRGVIMRPQAIPVRYAEEMSAWMRGDPMIQHPLATWYVVSGDIRPTTCARVPTTLVPAHRRAPVMRVLRAAELEQQLSITYRLDRGVYEAYVLARSGSDFTDDDLVVARTVQRLLVGLDRHVSMISRLSQDPGARCVDVGLTAREYAVLRLVAAGYSTQSIAQRLLCSPRTVNKHLEHAYRKLGVSDRINAIRVAGIAACAHAGSPHAAFERLAVE